VFAHACDELTEVAISSVDLLKKSVDRRATGTPLVREEFHEDRAMARLRVIGVRVGRWLHKQRNHADRQRHNDA
jgi:hypothetical protein